MSVGLVVGPMPQVEPLPKPKKKARQGSAMKRCDTLFSKVVRARDKRCQNCGDRNHLQCAHLISRSYKAIRCDESNAVALCRACHVKFTHRPLEWAQWCDDKFGEGYMRMLRTVALAGGRNDWKQIEADLKQRLEGL